MEKARANSMTTFDGILKEVREGSSETAAKVAEQVTKTAKQAVMKVDRTVHRNPWYFIGSVAVVMGAMGFYIGRKLKF